MNEPGSASPQRRLRPLVGNPAQRRRLLGLLFLPALALAAATNCSPPDRGIIVDGSVDGTGGMDLGGAGGGGTGGASSGGATESGGATASGGAGDGGAASGGAADGGASSGGAPPDGGASSGGTSGGGGGSGGTGNGGSGGSSCEDSTECPATTPICDETAGQCRDCGGDMECSARSDSAPYCVPSGECAECADSAHCPPSAPVCESNGTCGACQQHGDCASGACAQSGECVPSDQIVYALAQTGSTSAGCGSAESPCRFLDDAVAQLSASRNFLVLVETQAAFDLASQMILPAGIDVTMIGNSVAIQDTTDPLIQISGNGKVRIEDMDLQGTTNGDDQTFISVSGGEVTVLRSTFQGGSAGIDAVDAMVHVSDCAFDLRDVGVSVDCTSDCASVPASLVERSQFRNVATAVYFGAPGSTFTNNLAIEIATAYYNRGVMLYAEQTAATFNTLIRSGSCIYTGLFNCAGSAGTAILVGNITYDSTVLGGGPCYSQVYESCPNPSYSISEVTFPGTGNTTMDPLFVDAAGGDYHLQAGSPAVDLVPEDVSGLSIDLDGNPRPVGDGLDAGAFERQ